MQAMLPLLHGFAPTDIIVWHRGQPVTAARFCHAARAMAARLPRSRFAFNLCESQIHFLLASAAALVAGQTLILPPTRLRTVVADLRRGHDDSYCLIDAATPTDDTMSTNSVVVSIAFDDAADWPPPSVPASHEAAILYTSGSTHEPQPQIKRWVDLVNGTDTLVKSLGAPARGTAIIGTVAPQHMFGFETTVMLPLQSGTPVRDARPVYPADLAEALVDAAGAGIDGIWLMTTPLQLRAFHRELRDAPGLRQIIASTMPLDFELAEAIERDWHVPVYEIYGCTEAGILATRRPARTRRFTPAAGLTFTLAKDDTAQVAGGHLPEPLTLSDRIRLCNPDVGGAEGDFELLGRNQDIVKIAGKRASLAGLTQQLLTIPGVRDGVVFLPDPAAARVAAVVVAPGLSATEVRAELAVRIDAAFMPRPLVFVDALPRESNAKLPLADLRNIIDNHHRGRIATSSASSAQTVLTRQWSIAVEHPALPGHFPGQPIVPGVLLLQMAQTMLNEAGYRVRECREVKFRAPVAPAVPIDFCIEIPDGVTARVVARTASGTAMTGTFICQGSGAPA